MKKIIASILFTLVFSTHSFANCLPIIESKIKTKEEKLLKAKRKQKKATIITGSSVGGANAIFWGVMFKLITDGATIPTAILAGTGFGLITGGTAVAAVAVPMITYNQIKKAQIRKLKKTNQLLAAAKNNNLSNKLLQKMFKKVSRKIPELTMTEMIDELNLANNKMIFCPENGEKIYGFNKIKNYLRRLPVEETGPAIIIESVDGETIQLN